MRTYQILRPASGGDAVMNSLVMGTAFIWVPAAALYIGYQVLNDKFGEPAYEREAIAAIAQNRAWLPSPEKLLPANAGSNIWSVKDGSLRHILTDKPCANPKGRTNQRYLMTVSEHSDGTYSVKGHGCYGVSSERVFIYSSSPALPTWEDKITKKLSEVKSGLPTAGLWHLWNTSNYFDQFDGDRDNFKGNPFDKENSAKQGWKDDPIVKSTVASKPTVAPNPTVSATPERQRLAKAQALCSELYPLYRQHRIDGLCQGAAGSELRAAKDAVAKAAVASKPTVAVENAEPAKAKRVPSLDEAYAMVAAANTPAELRKATDAVSLAKALAN